MCLTQYIALRAFSKAIASETWRGEIFRSGRLGIGNRQSVRLCAAGVEIDLRSEQKA